MEAAILYNLYQLIRQSHVIYVLSYKLFFIIYLGCFLIYWDLDVFVLILWLVYGSLIIVVFIMTLMWGNVYKIVYGTVIFRSFILGGSVMVFGVCVLLGSVGSAGDVIYELGWI